MGFSPDMFTVMFAIPRTVGWLAQWQEMLADPDFVVLTSGRAARLPDCAEGERWD